MIHMDMKQSIRYGMLLCAFWLTAVASFGFVTCVSDDGTTEIQAHHHTLVHSRCSTTRLSEQPVLLSLEHKHLSCRHECEDDTICDTTAFSWFDLWY